MDTRGIERAVIGGVSMGGYVALQFLARHPARLAGLLLADTKAVADTAEQAANRNSIADRAEAGEVPAGADLVAPLLGPAASEQVRTLAAALADDAAPPAVAWAQRAMAVRPDSTDVLAAAAVPVLVDGRGARHRHATGRCPADGRGRLVTRRSSRSPVPGI